MATKKKTEVETAAVEETVESAVEKTAETVAEEASENTAGETDQATVKVKVLSKFRDKHTGKIYKPGETIEVTEARLVEMNTGKVRVQKL